MDRYYKVQEKITDLTGLKYMLSYYRFKEKKIVFTEGCFDLLHKGHIKFLSRASDLGEVLIVAINSDSSARKNKGANRPIQDHGTRSVIIASLGFVDHVIVFEEENAMELIDLIRPDILVRGADCIENGSVAEDVVKDKVSEIVTLDILKGYSTSAIVDKIKKMS